jgi:hypothetical protein
MSGDFEFEYGTWSVRHRRLVDRLAGCDEWEHFEGTTICAPILDGVGNFEQVWMPSIDMVGMALRLFDRTTREWSIHWSSNRTGRLEPPVVGRFVNGIGTFEADEDFNGQPIRVRFVWDEISSDRARWTQSFRRDGDTDWEDNWVMDLTRRSHDAPAASNTPPPLA